MSAATARAVCRSNCANWAIAWAGTRCARRCAAMVAKPCSPSLAAQALYAPHHRFDPRQAVRPQPAARPAQARPGQKVVNQCIIYLPLASGQRVYCCAFQDVCTKQVVGLVPPRRHCAGAGRHARSLGDHGLAAGAARPTARPRLDCPLRPGSYPVGRPVRGQCLQNAAAQRQGPALA